MPCLLDREALTLTTSGRAALLLALETLGIGGGDRVLLPTYHCPSMVAPVTALRGVPLFYPIDETGAPVVDWLEAQDLRGVRAMIVAHFFGIPQPMAALRTWTERHGIALFEDCAHALFGRCGERSIGEWGDMAFGSLPKFLPVPEGGFLITKPGVQVPPLTACAAGLQLKAGLHILETGARYRRLRGLNGLLCGVLDVVRHILRADGPSDVGIDDSAEPILKPLPVALDADFRIDPALAHRRLTWPSAWLATRLPRQRVVEHRRAMYGRLTQRLAGRAGIRPLRAELPAGCAPYVFPLWVDQPDPGYAELRRRRIPVFRWDRVWPGVNAIAGDWGLRWSHHVLQLACHQDLDRTDVDNYVDALVEVLAPPPPSSKRISTRSS